MVDRRRRRVEPPAPAVPEPFPSWAWPVVLAALFVLVFHRFWNHVVIFRDSLQLFAPYKRWIAEGLRNGSIHGWYPWQFLGMPFVANIEAGWFYPLNVLYLVLPFGSAHTAFILVHYPIAAGTMAFLLKSRGIGGWPALVGGLAYALSGYLVCQHATVTMLIGASWAPLALAFALRAIEGSRRAAVAAGAVLALQLFGGDPQTAAVTAVAIAIAAGVVAIRDRDRLRAAGIAIGVTGVSAFALAAAQIVPTWELMRLSVRRGGLPIDEAQIFSLHPAELVGLFWPTPFGGIYPVDDFRGKFLLDGPYDNPWSITHYVGIPLLALATVGMIGSRRRMRIGAALAAAVFLVLALGRYTPAYRALHAVLPVFDAFRYPAKYMAGVSACLAIEAALGLEVVLDRLREAPERVARGALALGAASIGVVGITFTALDSGWSGGAHALTVGLLAAAILLAAARGRLAPRHALPAFVALVAADGMVANVATMPAGPGDLFDSRPAAAALLEPSGPPGTGSYRIFREPMRFRDPEPSRGGPVLERQRLWERATLMRNLDAMEGFEDVVGYSASKMIDGLQLLKSNFTPPVMERFGVRYVLAAHGREPLKSVPSEVVHSDRALDLTILRLPGAGPRAYWTPSALRARDEEDAIRLLRDRATRGRVVLVGEGEPALDGAPAPETREARIAIHEPDRVVVEFDAPGPGWLVLNDRNYPGWIAEVDGVERPIVTADLMVRAVRVGPGRGAVTFRFVSWPIRIGATISALAWIAAAAAFATSDLRRRLRAATIPVGSRIKEVP